MGTLGEHGKGLGELQGVRRADVDLWMGTLSKSFGSCGGFIGASREMVHYLRYTTPGFVFANGIPPTSTGAALTAVQVLSREPHRVAKLRENAQLFLELARHYGLDTGVAMGTAIVPVITGSSVSALQLSEKLFTRGINAQPILHPAVEEEKARVRFFITSEHTEEQIREAVEKVAQSAFEIDPALASRYRGGAEVKS